MEMEALRIHPDVKQRDHRSHYEQELGERDGTEERMKRKLWGSTSNMGHIWEKYVYSMRKAFQDGMHMT